MPESAFIVHVPEAEPRVAALRERFDASVKLGVPAHVTLLYPFMAPGQITPAVLDAAQTALDTVPAFEFSLSKVAGFPATTYLAPEPATPFIALTDALVRAFPAYPPFGGVHAEVIPHLTVANGDAAAAERAADELQALMQSHGAIHACCTSVMLLENASGLWRPMHTFALPAAPRSRSQSPHTST